MTLIICSQCEGFGHYLYNERTAEFECTECGHLVLIDDVEPYLEPGERIVTTAEGFLGHVQTEARFGVTSGPTIH